MDSTDQAPAVDNPDTEIAAQSTAPVATPADPGGTVLLVEKAPDTPSAPVESAADADPTNNDEPESPAAPEPTLLDDVRAELLKITAMPAHIWAEVEAAFERLKN